MRTERYTGHGQAWTVRSYTKNKQALDGIPRSTAGPIPR
eukprot:COSAG02_NODE_7646_length_2918_cov_1.722242_1_plen_39_part_00